MYNTYWGISREQAGFHLFRVARKYVKCNLFFYFFSWKLVLYKDIICNLCRYENVELIVNST